MRIKFEFGVALAALALVATACFGGGEEATLALDGPQIAGVSEVTIADVAPTGTVEVEPEGSGGEPGGDPATEVEHPQESYTYADDLERAASMVLVPGDLADGYPALALDASQTDEVTNLMAAARADDAEAAVELVTTSKRVTGYQSVMVTPHGAEMVDGSLVVSVDRTAGPITTEVHLFDGDAGAEAWLAAAREQYASSDGFADAAGLPGDAFVSTVVHDAGFGREQATAVVGFARGAMVATVEIAGEGATDTAVDVARALAVRTHRVQEGVVPPRDPYPHDGSLHVPQRRLDSFRATSEITVLSGDDALLRLRSTGTYQDADHFSCNAVVSSGGTETLAWDLTVDGNTAWHYRDAAQSGKVDTMTAGVADLYEGCVANPDFWRNRTVYGFDGLPAGRGSTAAGPAAAYETDDFDAVLAAFGWDAAPAEELVHYQEYVTEAGWSIAFHYESTMPRSAVEEVLGSLPGSGSRVTLRETRRITDANGSDLTLGEFIDVEATFDLDVGEEIELVPAQGG